MARRGIATYEPQDAQEFNIFWQERSAPGLAGGGFLRGSGLGGPCEILFVLVRDWLVSGFIDREV